MSRLSGEDFIMRLDATRRALENKVHRDGARQVR
jgi:hypothetical protein